MTHRVRDLDSHKLDFHLEELLAWKNGEDVYPIHLDVGPSGYCTHNCLHCYLKWYGDNKNLLSKEVLDSIIEDGKNLNLKSIFLAGSGEPLLNPHTPDFIIKGKKSGIDIAMATNALLLKEHVSEKILPYINWIRFSVQAYNPKKYALLHGSSIEDRDIVFKNIRKFMEIKGRLGLDLRAGILVCLLPDNICEIEDLINFAKEVGLSYIALRPMSLNKRNKFQVDNQKLYESVADRLTILEKKYSNEKFDILIRHNLFNDVNTKKNYTKCYGVHFINQIDADGGIYACGPFVGHERYCFGNLNKYSYREIITSERRRRVLKEVENLSDAEECDTLCRCHNINKYLWRYKNPPRDINFI